MIINAFVLPYLYALLQEVNVDYYHIVREEHYLFIFVLLDHLNHYWRICSSRMTSTEDFALVGHHC